MSAAALDRQIRDIYDSLDTGSNKSAIVSCNKLLKKFPRNTLIKALKALALIRSQKVEESLVLCDEVLEAHPTDDAVLTAMMHVLRGLGRHNDLVTMFEEAFKKVPTNEEMGAQAFFANVRTANWKSGQQVATRMFKQFQEVRYLYWSIMCSVLQANDASTPPAMRNILYKLAHRLLSSSPVPSYQTSDRFHLHLTILLELDLFEEAETLLNSDVGKSICATNLSCDEIRRAIYVKAGKIREEGERAENLIVEKHDRNWLEFLAVLDATLPADASSEPIADSSEKIAHTREVFSNIEKSDGLKDRSAALASIELEKRCRIHGVSQDGRLIVALMKEYFDKVGDKACCFEDLKPYLDMESKDLSDFKAFLEGVPKSFTTVSELRKLINSYKIRRYILSDDEVTSEKEAERLADYTRFYFEGLSLGASLPSTELQPADDLALLAGNAYISLWTLTNDEKYLLNASYFLEFALTKSKQSFLTRLLLIRIYRLLGAAALVVEHYRAMGIKQVQHDTLSYLLLSRASTFSLASVGDLTLATECLESTQVYLSNSQETGDFVVRAFTAEKYSQIPEFTTFEDRLDNSLQRDTVKVEHLRMRLTHEPITSDIVDMELIELKFVFDRHHHDNRDFTVLPDYQPKTSPGLHKQTLLFGKPEGAPWLSAFLKIYIRAFQQASDLDDTVEEKLLIGDRPKQTAKFDKSLTLRDRLLQQDPESESCLTSDESKLVQYVNELANWLEPYHNYARPPPSVVLAEAAKQTELKTGHPLKGIEMLPSNGASAHKKDEEPPAVQDPPAAVVEYFEDIKTRFAKAKSQGSPIEALHVATLAQEAYLLFITETMRFKSSSVVKTNKFSALVPSFKSLRSPALSSLKDISAQLVKRAAVDGSSESRTACLAACEPTLLQQLDRNFVFTHAKKITEARRKVLEGVGKGMAKICATYGS